MKKTYTAIVALALTLAGFIAVPTALAAACAGDSAKCLYEQKKEEAATENEKYQKAKEAADNYKTAKSEADTAQSNLETLSACYNNTPPNCNETKLEEAAGLATQKREALTASERDLRRDMPDVPTGDITPAALDAKLAETKAIIDTQNNATDTAHIEYVNEQIVEVEREIAAVKADTTRSPEEKQQKLDELNLKKRNLAIEKSAAARRLDGSVGGGSGFDPVATEADKTRADASDDLRTSNAKRMQTASEFIAETKVPLGRTLSIPGQGLFTEIGNDGQPQFSAQKLITRIIDVLVLLVGTVAFVLIAIGGAKMILFAGSETELENAKQTVEYAAVGLAVTLAAYVIVTAVQSLFYR